MIPAKNDIPSARVINHESRNNDTENFAENLEVVSRLHVNVRKCCVDDSVIYSRVNALPALQDTRACALLLDGRVMLEEANTEGWDGRDFSTSRNGNSWRMLETAERRDFSLSIKLSSTIFSCLFLSIGKRLSGGGRE